MVKLREGKNQIKAVTKNGKELMTDQIEQVYQTQRWGKPAKLQVEEIAREDDIITVQAKLLDKDGIPCLDAKNWIYFDATGDGELIIDQGTSIGARKVQAYNGRALIRLRLSAGKAVVSGRMDESKSTLLTIEK